LKLLFTEEEASVDNLLPQIESIFRDVFDNPQLNITTETTARDVPGWDSLTNINLIFAVERAFRIKFALGEIQELKNVGEMTALIHKKSQNAARS
jgi:acyl carrier protein